MTAQESPRHPGEARSGPEQANAQESKGLLPKRGSGEDQQRPSKRARQLPRGGTGAQENPREARSGPGEPTASPKWPGVCQDAGT